MLINILGIGACALNPCLQETAQPKPFEPTIISTEVVDNLTLAPNLIRMWMPPEKYFFVEYWIREESKGSCTSKYIDFPGYFWNDDGQSNFHNCNGEPYENTSGILTGTSQITQNTIGLLGMGRQYCGENGFGTYSSLVSIDSLPYKISNDVATFSPFELLDKEIIIYGFDENLLDEQIINVSVEGKNYLIEPDQSWIYRTVDIPKPNCTRTTTYWLTNYGLLDKQNTLISP
jgi:hypothetical protein